MERERERERSVKGDRKNEKTSFSAIAIETESSRE
jgi:hypothetical protein